MFIVYVIVNSFGKIYIGQTIDLEKRLQRHNQELPAKKKSYTYKQKGSWQLAYKEKFERKEQAMQREKELKSYRGRIYIKNLISDTGR